MDIDVDMWALDDVNGGSLPLRMVQEARKEEVDFMVGRKIWRIVPIEECWAKTGKPPVTVKWVDTDKGTPGSPVIRSRLVARDFKGGDKDRDDLFAETPPLAAKRLLVSRAATRKV